MKAEQIKAWTPQVTVSSDDNLVTTTQNNYIRITSALNWCWFVVQRFIFGVLQNQAITAFFGFNSSFRTVNLGYPANTPFMIQFPTGGGIILPVTIPQVVGGFYYWASYVNGNLTDLSVYANENDALNNVHKFAVGTTGTNATISSYAPNVPKLTLESLDFNSYTDMTTRYVALNANQITGLGSLYEGNWLSIIADGYVVPNAQVTGGVLPLPLVSQNVTIGLPYISNFSPLPYANLPNGVGLYSPKHIKGFYLNYYNSLGIQIQGFDIPDLSLNNIAQNMPPPLKSGVFLFGMMEDWDPFSYVINVTQSNPLPMTILGIGYVLEV